MTVTRDPTLIVTSSATDKKLKIDKNLENKFEIYSYFILENKLEILELFVNGR